MICAICKRSEVKENKRMMKKRGLTREGIITLILVLLIAGVVLYFIFKLLRWI